MRALRTAIVGASTLLGKEIAEQVAAAEPTWSLTLLDEELSAGQVTSAGDEAAVIQPLVPGALSDLDLVFFASDSSLTRTHWAEVKRSGAQVVDLSCGLESEPGLVTFSPWIEGNGTKGNGAAQGPALSLSTMGILAPHSAALFLALVATRLQAKFGSTRLIATVLQPASQYGKAALDELHAQTAALLTFQSTPKEVFGTQTAFNLLPSFGADTKLSLAIDAARIRRDFEALASSASLELQLIQAPVFHNFGASIYVELPAAESESALRRALEGGVVRVAGKWNDEVADSEADSLLIGLQGSAGSGPASSGQPGLPGSWMWMSADNLRLTARHAVACAAELARFRPVGKVQ